jgi:aminocarboxymuconate-semialdehyde decarboxylase
LQYLISVVGAERVLFGTDWPHQVHDTKGAFANTAQLPEGHTRAVRSENAQRIFEL